MSAFIRLAWLSFSILCLSDCLQPPFAKNKNVFEGSLQFISNEDIVKYNYKTSADSFSMLPNDLIKLQSALFLLPKDFSELAVF